MFRQYATMKTVGAIFRSRIFQMMNKDIHMKQPAGNALRKGRVSIPGQIYLITTVTYNRIPVFQDVYAGRVLVNAIHRHCGDAETLCYVVMPDHLHWLVQLGDRFPLARLMQQIKSESGFHIKQKWQLPVRLWQPGYHDHALRKEEDIKAVARYVIANPLRAGLVKRVGDYSLWDAVWV